VNVHMCRIVLRPRGPLEVFDLTFALLRVHAAVIARLTAVVVGPLALVCAIGAPLTGGHPAWLLAPVLAAPLIGVPFTLLAGRLLFADRWTVRLVFRELFSRPGATASVLAWSLVLEALGWLFCGVGLLVTRPLGAFLAESALLERTPLSRLVTRSFRLALLHPSGALAVVGAWFVVTAWGMVAGEAIGDGLVNVLLQLGRPFGTAWEGRVTPYVLVGGLLVQPIFSVYRVLQFVDLRTRLDGWDLQIGLRAARLGREAPNR
jgi:hypothetical protein